MILANIHIETLAYLHKTKFYYQTLSCYCMKYNIQPDIHISHTNILLYIL